MTNVIRLPLGVCTNMMPPFYKKFRGFKMESIKNFSNFEHYNHKVDIGSKKVPNA